MFKPGHASVPSNAFGSAPDAATTPEGVEVSFDGGPRRNRQTTSAVVVTNRELVAGNTLEISFANGRDGSWFAVAPNTTIQIPVMTHRMRLRGTTGAVALYSVMGIIA
jgi:hypothetical protein